MAVEDYYQQGKRWWLRLHEKGGTHHALPVHHTAEAALDAYLDATGIADEKGARRRSPRMKASARPSSTTERPTR